VKTISIITPCFNEEDSIVECYEKVAALFQGPLAQYRREHIFCDNCSTDSTVEKLREIAKTDANVKIIVNSRNFGILRNTFNGVVNATGDAILLFMPVDLQDPPELLPEFVKLWEQGYEIVFGIRAQREEPFLMRTLRHLYYQGISRLSYIDFPPDVGDFQLIDRKVLEAMKQFDDRQPFMRMMTFDCGFRSIGVPYTWRARARGISRNRLSQLIDQGLIGLISFSNIPMRLALFFGAILSFVSVAYALFVLIAAVVGGTGAPRGIPTIIIALFFFSGLQFLFLGLLGEYIIAIHNQSRKRPIVVERERINF